MASQPLGGERRRRGLSGARRPWLSHAGAALGISALGLAVAASMSLTTNAQTPIESAGALPLAIPRPADTPPTATPKPSKVANAFSRPEAKTDKVRSVPVRKAIAAERAAQRAEQLAKSAEAAAAADKAAATKARQQKLVDANDASRESAEQLVQESIRRTALARLEAEKKRASAEADPATGLSATSTTPVIPAGTTGSAPVPGAVVGARFGQYGMWSRYHTGIDFRAAYGVPIRAVLPGVVLYAGNSGDWAGNHVAVKHADGTTTMYSHMSSMASRPARPCRPGRSSGTSDRPVEPSAPTCISSSTRPA